MASIDTSQTVTIPNFGSDKETIEAADILIGSEPSGNSVRASFQNFVKSVATLSQSDFSTYKIVVLDGNGHIPSTLLPAVQTSDGNHLFFGEDDPGNTAGNQGDVYFATNNQEVWRLESVSGQTRNWEKKTSYRGTQVSFLAAAPTSATPGRVNDVIFVPAEAQAYKLIGINGDLYNWQLQPAWASNTTVLEEDIDRKISEVINDVESSQYWFFEDGFGNIPARTPLSHLGTLDFTISFTARFPLAASVPTERTILNTIYYTTHPPAFSTTPGYSIRISTAGKVKVYLNDTNNRQSTAIPHYESTGILFGKLANVILAFDRSDKLKIYINGKLDSEHVISAHQGSISNDEIARVGAPVFYPFATNLPSERLRDFSLYSLCVFSRVLDAEAAKKLYQDKNTPPVTDAFAEHIYTSNFSSGVDGWTAPIARRVTHHSLSTGDFLRVASSAVSTSRPIGAIRSNTLEQYSTYRLKFQARRVAENTHINGFWIFAGEATYIVSGVVTNPPQGQIIVDSGVINDSEWRDYDVYFGTQINSAALGIVLYDDGTWVTGDGNDGWDFRNFDLDKVGAIANYQGHNALHHTFLDAYTRAQDIDMVRGITLGKDEVSDHGTFEPNVVFETSSDTPNVSLNKGHYRVLKDGLVHVHGRVLINTIQNHTQPVFITNLPFKSHANADALPFIVKIDANHWENVEGAVYGLIEQDSNQIDLKIQRQGSGIHTRASINGTNIPSGTYIYFDATYAIR